MSMGSMGAGSNAKDASHDHVPLLCFELRCASVHQVLASHSLRSIPTEASVRSVDPRVPRASGAREGGRNRAIKGGSQDCQEDLSSKAMLARLGRNRMSSLKTKKK